MPDEHQKKQVGQYYLLEKLAQGGMAEIFKGLSYDVHGIKKTVCIKKILPQIAANKELIDALISEAKLAVKMVHGNIAQTYDLGKVDDDYFMVMEYVEGRSLSQINKRCLAKGEFIPVPFLAYFVSEVLAGLDYMHRRTDESGVSLHIVHRDISPQNIMASYSGTVKIIDFGIAKTRFRPDATDSGTIKGKFAYMSPEQAHGDSIDHRSDVFSLGVIFHEMLTGKRLFKAEDSRQTLRNVRKAAVAPPSSIREGIPEELDRIALTALAKDRRRRYPSASKMRDDLLKFLHTQYPDFNPSGVGDFVRELFKDESAAPQAEDADSKTPHLIIDWTNSALADDSQFEVTGRAKAPVDMSEYMLEGETGEKAPQEEREGAPLPGIEAGEEYSLTPMREWAKRFWKFRMPDRRTIIKALLSTAAIAIVVAGVLVVKNRIASHGPAPAPFGEVMVVSHPSDARVFLNGKEAGRGSPVTLKNIPAGEEQAILVEQDGYIPHRRHVNLDAGEFLSIKVTLVKASPDKAALEFETKPSGASIYIDDRDTGKRTPHQFPDIEPEKEHKLGLYLEGHAFWEKNVKLKASELKSFDVTLTKNLGGLVVRAEPEGSLVMIDGAPAGQAPLKRDGLEPDRVLAIEVWHDGFAPAKREVKITAGRQEELDIVLERLPTPAEEEFKERTKKEEKNGQGQEGQ